MRRFLGAGVLILSISFGAAGSYAKSVSLIGVWHGGGIVLPKGGAKEKTRCRAEIQKSPGRGLYLANYKCSSPLGLISQTVAVKKISATKYSGTFHNVLHKVKGVFSITLDGNKQTVTMKSSQGEGWLDLNRQNTQ
ncbi:MAG: hypothetical protein GY927_11935 [bacterium]|nr:hypothetical protein [bacterium]